MSANYAGPSCQKLKESLEASVLSESYQRLILSYALDSYSEGFRAGKESAAPSYGLTAQPTITIGGIRLGDGTVVDDTNLYRSPPSRLTTTEPEVIFDVLRDSIEEESFVRIDYVDRHGERTTDREVGPVELVDDERGVVCFDVDKDAYRRFNIDSIKLLTVGGS